MWCLGVFVLGLCVGSFLNVLIARLPYEKSIIWPSSRCFACSRPIRFTDNVPILGYLLLRGKCRFCKAPFSARYLWVELGTGVAFLALFVAEVLVNWHRIPEMNFNRLASNLPPGRCLAMFGYHATLVTGLIAAAAIDAEHRIIPMQITYPVMVVGIIGGALMPWPWPQPPSTANAIPAGQPWFMIQNFGKVPTGVQPWPFWGPTPAFAPPGSWQLGLLTSLIGALAGSLVVRATKWLFETGFGREALGLGDADLLMMAGAFLGWQIAVLSLFAGAFAGLMLKLAEFLLRGKPPDNTVPTPPTLVPVTGPPQARELPFGPGLAIGVVATWFAWPWLGPQLQFPFFDGETLGWLGAMMGVGLLAAALFLRRPAEAEPAAAR